MPIESVQGVVRYEQATPVPRAPEIVQGVINLRGQVIPVVDLTRKLLNATFEPGPYARIVVAESDAGIVGLAVDAASEVVQFAEEDIRPAPESALSSETAGAFAGVVEHEGRLVILLNLDEAIPRAEYAHVATAGGVTQEGEDDV